MLNVFSVPIEKNHMIFILHSDNVVYYVDWFADVKTYILKINPIWLWKKKLKVKTQACLDGWPIFLFSPLSLSGKTGAIMRLCHNQQHDSLLKERKAQDSKFWIFQTVPPFSKQCTNIASWNTLKSIKMNVAAERDYSYIIWKQ